MSSVKHRQTVADYNETGKNAQNALQSVLRRCRKELYLTCSDVFLNISTFKSAFKNAIMSMRQAEGL
ncbi:hypothetical protein DLR57_23285 [Salmonella enterica subsp. enterica]|nr:hypothetical protein [Salmonella enterica subsp. enterica serovar Virchow]EBL4693361.1 hypothetical protein [Salmonella enterica subsp. enterica serovar Infantis]EEU9447091.1 hypothetical protein [Escherichia coli]EBU9514712.1 hypothetical protein [Salmonella enterica subsp. enterica serovar Virchow]ECB7428238.1 hypothetical protein [Salmonella enterica subsp. enterica serovar Virchow]